MFGGGLAREECWEKGLAQKRAQWPSSRKEDRESTGPSSSRDGSQEPRRGAQTSRVMAEKTSEDTRLWNEAILQDASVSKLSHLVGWGQGRTGLSFLPQEC